MKIDLGQKNDSPMCCATDSPEKKDRVYYPSLYFTHDEPVNLPEEGTAVITFRRIESSENNRDPDDPKYRCEIEVHSIEVKGGEPNIGAKLKDGLRKAMKKGEYEEEQ